MIAVAAEDAQFALGKFPLAASNASNPELSSDSFFFKALQFNKAASDARVAMIANFFM